VPHQTQSSDLNVVDGQVNQAGNEFEFAALSEARNYRKAIVSAFGPFVRGNTLEVGCGIGQFTQDLQKFSPGARITGLEPDPAFHLNFRRNNPKIRLLEGTAQEVIGELDCIVSVNVLEHIKDDAGEIQTYKLLLKKGGHLCLFVPARQELFSSVDAKFGHFRRYSRRELQGKLEAGGFRLVTLQYFNMAGYVTWFVVCKLLRRQTFSRRAIRLFDRWILPFSIALGRLLGNPIGQSLILVATKPES
jgi:SAM-dependent methyltransferase